MSSQAQGGVDLFSSLLDELIAERSDITVSTDPSGVWLHVEPRDAVIPAEGWKLHVSAIPSSAAEVLTRVVPLLAAVEARLLSMSSSRQYSLRASH